MSLPPRCSVLILDLGDVLFTWSPVTATSISPKLFKSILASTIWQQYERGRISEDECYRLCGERFSVDTEELRRALVEARTSLRPNDAFIRFICALQAQAQLEGPPLRVFGMSNISAPDYAYCTRTSSGITFERVFTSADAGMRKPDLCFFQFVLAEIGAQPSECVFVDDDPENVLAARSLGMNAVVFDDVKRVRQSLRSFTGDPVSRGIAFLEDRAGRLDSETDGGQVVAENFSQLLIWEATNKRELVNFVHHPRTWNFFRDGPVLTTKEFPADLDTTSIGLMATQPDDAVFNSVMDEMLQYTSPDGIATTYFDTERLRTDPVVALNILRLFHSRARGSELSRTLDWVLNVLQHRAYLSGTRYYQTAESFLFFFSRLLPHLPRSTTLAPLLRARILERAGAPGDALALAMRVLAGMAVGVRLERDLGEMVRMQEEDGGWAACWVYKYGSSGVKIGNRGLSTAFALNAIAALHSSSTPQPQPQSQSQSQSQPQPQPQSLVAERRIREAGSPLRLHARLGLGGRHGAGLGVVESWPSVTWWLIFLSLIIPWLLSTVV